MFLKYNRQHRASMVYKVFSSISSLYNRSHRHFICLLICIVEEIKKGHSIETVEGKINGQNRAQTINQEDLIVQMAEHSCFPLTSLMYVYHEGLFVQYPLLL